jgi:hypothetical protein
MAYHLHHKCEFYNCLNEKLLVELYKKDVAPVQVTQLLATSFVVNYPTGEGDKFDPIVSCEARLSLYLQSTDDETFDDFIVTFPDEWKMIAYDDDQVVFAGFLIPGEGRSEFQNKPYEVTVSATDGLGLLKGVPLTRSLDEEGIKFTGVNLIIDYVMAILNKTGLGLNLLLFSSIVEESMEDRTQNPLADTFNQTGLHARTFLKNPTEFHDCYTCLQRILSEYFTLYQWNGKWVILRVGELQENAGAKMWYTEYNTDGTAITGDQSPHSAAAVGRDRLMHPVESGQFIGSNFAVKSVRYTYNYSTWPEMPTNNKFERGAEFESGPAVDLDDLDNDGNTSEVIGTYKKYTIDDMEQGVVDLFDLPHPAMVPTTKKFYRRSIFNEFGVEIQREIVSDTEDLDGNHDFWLRTEGMPVYAGDKIRIGLSKRFSNNFSNSGTVFTIPAVVYIVVGSNAYYLDNNISGSQSGTGRWRQAVNLGGQLILDFAPNQDTRKYASLSVNSLPIPFDGTLYIAFKSDGPSSNTGPLQYLNDFTFEYYPFVAGGYLPVEGDFAETSQNENLKDTIDEEVFISDSPKKVLQGALYRANLTDLTTPTWHRFNVIEQRHFKEIGELARFNNNYRRMWKIDGPFDGLKFTPADNGTVLEPISFHRHYFFPDSTLMNARYFVLVPPLMINYSEGRAELNFMEVLQDGAGDGNDTGDTHIPLKYIFK